MIRRTARRFRAWVRRLLLGEPIRPVILMYHRIGEGSPDPWGLAVSPAKFRDQLQWLADRRQVMPMQAFVDHHVAGTLPRNAVAITFDDGYADNVLQAQPMLAHAGLPATLFAVSEAVGRRQPFWWDTLARLLLDGNGECDASIDVGGERVRLRWRREHAARSDWRAEAPPPGPREAAYLEIWRRLQRAPEDERQSVIAALQTILGPDDGALDRAATEAEFAGLTTSGVFAVGGHSATHPAFSSLSASELEREVAQSLAFCRAIAPQGPIGFAYPYGDLNAAAREAVAAAGFAWACSTRRAAVDVGDDAFALPRVGVGDWSALELRRTLAGIAAA